MHVLLLEPSYYTQYPPLGLLKIATHHKMIGDTVQYLRGTSGLRFLHNVPDRVYITSLFTWAWKEVEQAIKVAKAFFPRSEVWLGGIYASLMPEHAGSLGADRIFTGIWKEVEGLLPDYSLVPLWNQKQKASIMFTQRGCIRRCPYCAVPALEGKPFRYCEDISIRRLVYRDHKKVILWDNNILGVPQWKDVIEEIKKLKLEVDFNQGIDARLINDEVAESFRGLNMKPIRLAYDYPAMGKDVKNAIELLESAGFARRNIVCYVLFNFEDTPSQLFDRVRDLLSWGATAYPMRFQPLDALEKDSYVARKWTEERLNIVAQARRVFGSGGAFPPYEGLVQKFLEARDFADAFSVWSQKNTAKQIGQESIREKKTIVFWNDSVTVQKSKMMGKDKGHKPIEKYIASSAAALGGKYVILVSSKGRVKKSSLLGIYRTVSGKEQIPLDKEEKIVSVQTEHLTNGNILCIVSRNGRVGAFLPDEVGSRKVDASLVQRLILDEADEVISAFCTSSKSILLAVDKSGWLKLLPMDKLHIYRGSGRGSFLAFPTKRRTQLQYAGLLNSNSITIQFTTTMGRRLRRSLDVDNMEKHNEDIKFIKLGRHEFVRRVTMQ